MSIKRLILSFLTLFVIFKVFLSLGESVDQPQIQSRLELYQTNLILHAAEFQPTQIEGENQESSLQLIAAKKAFFGSDPYPNAEKQYQDAIKEAKNNLETLKLPLENFIQELNLKLGILKIKQGEIENALGIWQELLKQSASTETKENVGEISSILIGLWSQPPVISTDAESLIEQNLQGWFRYDVLRQLYVLEDRQTDLLNLQEKEQEIALKSVTRLFLITGLPILGGMLGIGLVIFILVQWALKKEASLWAINSNVIWETPWDWEIVWQVLIIGFFCVSQFFLPLVFGLAFGIFNLDPSTFNLRFKAFYVLTSYIFMAIGGIGVLYASIKPFFPLSSQWFQTKLLGNWVFWGVGGYCVALPCVVVVSLLNQAIWQGQGGSNPLLFLALQAQDKVALGIFFFTASIAAPMFEEIIFRGFLLSSLTRYVPVWGSILISSLIFSVAHLSVSEILPLTTLGIILGFVYSRSRNILAPMLLHSLWNSGTLISLFILGSSMD